jgi:plastocyanin
VRKFLVALLAIVVVFITLGASCANSNSNVTSTNEKATITIENSKFTPNTLTVSRGTVVTWENKDNIGHQIISDGNYDQLESGVIEKNEDFVFSFDSTGVFPYHCEIHPEMKGTVTVK